MSKHIFLLILFVLSVVCSGNPVLAQTSSYKDIKSIAYAFPDQFLEPWHTLANELPKIKSIGFNTVWLFPPWFKYQTQAIPTPIYNDDNFAKLKEILALLKQNNMQAILPMDYLWEGNQHPVGINPLHWIKEPDQYAAYENYVKEFLTRIQDYSDIVYILFFSEGTYTNVEPYNAERHATLLRSTLGSLPDRLPQNLRSKFRFGFHDGDFFFNHLSPYDTVIYSPISSATTFDFYSGVNYYAHLGNNVSQSISIMDQQIQKFRRSYSDLPLIFGEFGAPSCTSRNGSEDIQASTDEVLMSYFLTHGYGFSMWGLQSPAPPIDCDATTVDGGNGIYYHDGTPKKVVSALKTIMSPKIENGGVDKDYQPWAIWLRGKNLSSLLRAQLYDRGNRVGGDLPVVLSQDHTWVSFQLPINFPTSGCNSNSSCSTTVQLLDTRSGLSSNRWSLFLPTLSPTPLLGDLDKNVKVDIFDYNLLIQNFGRTRAQGFLPPTIDPDIVRNDVVDIFDYNILVGNFGK